MKPVHEWLEVPNTPNPDPPKLPAAPTRRAPVAAPEPTRPLAVAGRQLWDRAWESSPNEPDLDCLLQVCEQADERMALRLRVLRDNDHRDRAALRVLDGQLSRGLVALANSFGDPAPAAWPRATRRWWKAVASLPHTVTWTDGDWQFAQDTAQLVAAFHAGDHRLAQEIRKREAIMGTTADARRDLRIRYVEPAPAEPADSPSVTAMATYRREVTA